MLQFNCPTQDLSDGLVTHWIETVAQVRWIACVGP